MLEYAVAVDETAITILMGIGGMSKSVQYYDSMDEYLNDPDPYGDLGWCDRCNYMVEIEHNDVFHEYTCAKCGYRGGENCLHHSIDLAKCQADWSSS
jgi:hypothetical protein